MCVIFRQFSCFSKDFTTFVYELGAFDQEILAETYNICPILVYVLTSEARDLFLGGATLDVAAEEAAAAVVIASDAAVGVVAIVVAVAMVSAAVVVVVVGVVPPTSITDTPPSF